MKRIAIVTGAMVCVLGVTVAFTDGGSSRIREFLLGVQEVPVTSTTGSGTLVAEIDDAAPSISYTLTFRDLEGDVTQSHIHIAPEQNTGNIVLWLCQTAANPSPVPAPSNPPQCFNPQVPGQARANTVSGTLTPADIAASAAANGIARGVTPDEAAAEFREAIALIRAGKTYVNVHSAKFGPGEIRSQIEHNHGRGGGSN
jgi:hypothetical protein